MKFLIYLLVGIGWVAGYANAQNENPTILKKLDYSTKVTAIVAWPVSASAELSNFLYTNRAKGLK